VEHSLAALFQTYTELEKPPILELRNINNKPVGALYMDKLKYKNFIISETNNNEKYYLYIDGIGIYFSFYSKISI
jgi:cytochrome b involved in lipid metabolism